MAPAPAHSPPYTPRPLLGFGGFIALRRRFKIVQTLESAQFGEFPSEQVPSVTAPSPEVSCLPVTSTDSDRSRRLPGSSVPAVEF